MFISRPVVALSALSLFAVAGCSNQESILEKPQGGKADATEKLCKQAGEPGDCDICELQGWYQDGECDDFCSMPDPDCGPARSPNPACDARLDSWMFSCLERNLVDETLEGAIDFCVGGVFDGEPIEIEGICQSDDEDCFIDLADNAEVCAAAIGEEFAERQPNPACDVRLDAWMFDCVERNLESETLEDAISFCVGGVIDGEPIEIGGICESGDDDCFIDLADNAEDCGAAIGEELE